MDNSKPIKEIIMLIWHNPNISGKDKIRIKNILNQYIPEKDKPEKQLLEMLHELPEILSSEEE